MDKKILGEVICPFCGDVAGIVREPEEDEKYENSLLKTVTEEFGLSEEDKEGLINGFNESFTEKKVWEIIRDHRCEQMDMEMAMAMEE